MLSKAIWCPPILCRRGEDISVAIICGYEEKQADRSPPVLLLRTNLLLKQLPRVSQLRRDEVAIRVRHAAAIVALAGCGAAGEVAVVERTDHESDHRQAMEGLRAGGRRARRDERRDRRPVGARAPRPAHR